MRGGFRALLDAQDDITVVGEAADGDEAVRLARRAPARRRAHGHPHAGRRRARRPPAASPTTSGCADVKVVILTTFDLDEYVFEAIRAGANGFLVKDTEPAELLRAVRAVVAGDALLSPRRHPPADRGVRHPGQGPGRPCPTSTCSPTASARWWRSSAEGLTNDEIAERLIMSAATAKTHVSRAMIKLGARDRAQLVVFAYETGLVRPGWQRLSLRLRPGVAEEPPRDRRRRAASRRTMGP